MTLPKSHAAHLARLASAPPRSAANYLRATAPKPAKSLLVVVPVKTVNPLNRRDHWAVKARRAKSERAAAATWLRTLCSRSRVSPPRLPAVVTLTRLAPRAMDSDGLAASNKHVRDGVQDVYQVDDASPLFEWVYRQEKGAYGVRIEIQSRPQKQGDL